MEGGGGGGSIPRSQSIAHGKLSLAPGRTTSNRVVINVGGVKYETFKSTLKSIPDTRLSWLTEAQGHNPDYDPASGEYFFDRHPGVFNMILNYYRTGRLHAPTDVCGPLFEEELAFWGIDEKQIEPCCWSNYRAHRDAQETLAEFDKAREEKQGFARLQPRVWHLLEDPNSSQAAKVLAVVSVVFVILFIAVFVAETHLQFRDVKDDVNATKLDQAKTVHEEQRLTQPKLWLIVFEYICVIYFTLEFIARSVFCPDKLEYCKHVLTWVDLISIVPFYVNVIALGIDPSVEDSAGLYVFKSIRVIRIFRILRLTRYFSGLKILGHTLKASAKELLLMILVLGIGVLVFACFIFFVEQVDEGARNDFRNIPIGFWWAVVTMTTLGYGDITPRTALGYMVGTMCALCGLLMLALPVPVIVNNFTLYYSHAQAKLKLPQKKKNFLVGAADALKNPDTAESSFDAPQAATKDKAASASTNGETTGISVIFTDELAADSSPSRLSPLQRTPTRKPSKRNSIKVGNNKRVSDPTSRKDSAISRRRSLHPTSMRVDIVDVDV
ncbi:hypothetical protein BaRGS_00022356 [Batillaria attramentaria]|uniref:BTB domain-containing protein n=1 Tax=Batillaria attramentaria TaxID=370345 RepID=A0ABD0KHA5_9CAEN